MTRILVKRGPSSSSNSNRSLQQSTTPQNVSPAKDDEQDKEVHQVPAFLDESPQQCGSSSRAVSINDDNFLESSQDVRIEAGIDVGKDKCGDDEIRDPNTLIKHLEGLTEDVECSLAYSSQIVTGRSYPPTPPVPPPKPSAMASNPRKTLLGSPNASSRRALAWPVVSFRTSPSNSRPTSPMSIGEGEGYNSADEHNTGFGASYSDMEK